MLDRVAARASRRRVWGKYWRMRKKRGGCCDTLHRRFFRRNPEALIRIERHFAQKWESVSLPEPEPVVVCGPKRQPWWRRAWARVRGKR